MDNYNNLSKKEVIKSNNLIESSYKLTTSEHRLIYLASTKLKKIMIDKDLNIDQVKKLIEDSRFDKLEINVQDYAKEFNVKGGSIYPELEETAKRLYDRNLVYADGDKVVNKRWVITCAYDNKNGAITLQFHPDLVKDLMIFKNKYTILKLENAKSIKNSYTFRIYELLKQYEYYGERTFDITNFRFLLGLEDTEYPAYANLKQRIIKPSIKEITKSTDLYIDEFEEIKKKRKVVSIKFKFHSQNVMLQEQLSFLGQDEIALDSDSQNVIDRLREILKQDLTAGDCEKIIRTAIESIENQGLDMDTYNYIKEKKKVVDEYSKTNEIGNYTAVLISAMRGNWQPNKPNNSFNNYGGQRKYDVEKLQSALLGKGESENYEI